MANTTKEKGRGAGTQAQPAQAHVSAAAELPEAQTHPVRVQVREASYVKLSFNPLGQPYLDSATGYGPGRPEINPANRGVGVSDEVAELDFKLGQRIDLLDNDYIRLINCGAVADAEAVEQFALEHEDDEVLDVRTASVEDLSRWIVQEKPNANDVVQASVGEPELAEKLLRAEAMAAQETNGEPRKSVVDGLSAVIARG